MGYVSLFPSICRFIHVVARFTSLLGQIQRKRSTVGIMHTGTAHLRFAGSYRSARTKLINDSP